jgi:hypothetical protein
MAPHGRIRVPQYPAASRVARTSGPCGSLNELGKAAAVPAPSRMSVYRVLIQHGLIEPGTRRRIMSPLS